MVNNKKWQAVGIALSLVISSFQVACTGQLSKDRSAKAAPSQLKYGIERLVLTQGKTMDVIRPVVMDGADVAYSIQPALPKGLELNAQTGEISGRPEEVMTETAFDITAKNNSGATAFKLAVVVLHVTPSQLIYPTLVGANQNAILTKGVASAEHWPQSKGGEITQYTVRPDLPNGMTLNPKTGVIAGVPRELFLNFQNFTITAQNSGGTTSTKIQLQVLDQAPVGFHYQSNDPESKSLQAGDMLFFVSDDIQVAPIQGRGEATQYSIKGSRASDRLPDGISFDDKTGRFFGEAKEITRAGARSFIITATNSGGARDTKVSIQVRDLAPIGFKYNVGRLVRATKGHALPQILPQWNARPLKKGLHGGAIDSFKIVEPDARMRKLGFIDADEARALGIEVCADVCDKHVAGEIFGAPNRLSEANHPFKLKVVGSNTGGSNEYYLDIEVVDEIPRKLRFVQADGNALPNGTIELVYNQEIPTGKYRVAYEGGAPTSFTPDQLINGVSLDQRGYVVGKPRELILDGRPLSIQAHNSGGSSQDRANARIRVIEEGPSELFFEQEGRPLVGPVSLEKDRLFPAIQIKTRKGGSANRWSAKTALPQGLVINPQGWITVESGAKGPQAITNGVQQFVIVAENSGGSTEGVLELEVRDQVPANLAFAQKKIVVLKGKEIRIPIRYSGGMPTEFDLLTQEPKELRIEKKDSELFLVGTPLVARAETLELKAFNDTAKNRGIQLEAKANLVVLSAPEKLTYSQDDTDVSGKLTLEQNQNFKNVIPDVQWSKVGSLFFTVTPALPDGMRIDANSGVIAGPMATQISEKDYEIRVVARASLSDEEEVEQSKKKSEAILTSAKVLTADPQNYVQTEAVTYKLHLNVTPEKTRNLEFVPSTVSIPFRKSLDQALTRDGKPLQVELKFTGQVPNPSTQLKIEPNHLPSQLKLVREGDRIFLRGEGTLDAAQEELHLKVSATTVAKGEQPASLYLKIVRAPETFKYEVEGQSKPFLKADFAWNIENFKKWNDEKYAYEPTGQIARIVPVTTDKTRSSGDIEWYEISPKTLPEGLEFNPEDGFISGTPKGPLAKSQFSIVGVNPAGKTKNAVTLTMEVKVDPLKISPRRQSFAMEPGKDYEIKFNAKGGRYTRRYEIVRESSTRSLDVQLDSLRGTFKLNGPSTEDPSFEVQVSDELGNSDRIEIQFVRTAPAKILASNFDSKGNRLVLAEMDHGMRLFRFDDQDLDDPSNGDDGFGIRGRGYFDFNDPAPLKSNLKAEWHVMGVGEHKAAMARIARVENRAAQVHVLAMTSQGKLDSRMGPKGNATFADITLHSQFVRLGSVHVVERKAGYRILLSGVRSSEQLLPEDKNNLLAFTPAQELPKSVFENPIQQIIDRAQPPVFVIEKNISPIAITEKRAETPTDNEERIFFVQAFDERGYEDAKFGPRQTFGKGLATLMLPHDGFHFDSMTSSEKSLVLSGMILSPETPQSKTRTRELFVMALHPEGRKILAHRSSGHLEMVEESLDFSQIKNSDLDKSSRSLMLVRTQDADKHQYGVIRLADRGSVDPSFSIEIPADFHADALRAEGDDLLVIGQQKGQFVTLKYDIESGKKTGVDLTTAPVKK